MFDFQVRSKVTSIFSQVTLYLLFLGSTVPVLRSLLVTICEVLLQSTRELPSPQELKDSQDGQDKSFLNTDHRLKVSIELNFSLNPIELESNLLSEKGLLGKLESNSITLYYG